MIEKQRVKRILSDLEGVNEDLLNLFEDIKHNIDPHDSASRAEGLTLLGQYNTSLSAFEKAAVDMRTLIEGITHVDMTGENERAAKTASQRTPDATARIVRQLDTSQPHSLAEDFTYIRPYAFQLSGRVFPHALTWRSVYQMFCVQLATINPERFKTLPDADLFRGRKITQFTTGPAGYKDTLKLPYGLCCEGYKPANYHRDNMRNLLTYFNIPESDFIIYLREDRDADEDE